ncbi:MAG: multiprotein bridging factor aMBF1 [Sulfolobales archaeon]
MSPQKTVYCEICGREIPETSAFKIYVENIEMIVCPSCYFKYVSSGSRNISRSSVKGPDIVKKNQRISTESSAKHIMFTPMIPQRSGVKRTQQVNLKIVEKYEVDPNYPEIIRRAREQRNMSTKDLALRLGESENVIKRIEAGKLIPTIDLARKIENILGVKIIVMKTEEEALTSSSSKLAKVPSDLTFGDVVAIRKKEK